LFNNVLEMARIDAGALAAEERWSYPSEIVSAARDQVEQSLKEHRVSLTIDRDIPVRLDARLAASALAHLLENAAQYAPKRTSIDVSSEVVGTDLLLRVRDHGPGIPDADLPRVFDLLPRPKRGSDACTGNRHGSVDRQGTDERSTRSHLGRELRGWRCAIHVGATLRRLDPRQGAGGVMTTRARILLVDDETSIQRAVAPLLRSRGYDVEIAGTGTEALRVVSDRAPDLIVLDLGLPDIEGTEMCRRVRETVKTPIIVLSARGAEADKVNALDLGADDYVTKPFGPEELLARIRVALRRVLTDEAGESGLLRAGDLTIDTTGDAC
jgi:CheY-like chemotaxis protein